MKLLRLCRYQWDRALAIVLIVVGFGGIITAWLLALQTIFAFQQIPELIFGGIGGMSLITVGAASWLSADLRDEWRKLDDLEAAVRFASHRAAREAAAEPAEPLNGSLDHGIFEASPLSMSDRR